MFRFLKNLFKPREKTYGEQWMDEDARVTNHLLLGHYRLSRVDIHDYDIMLGNLNLVLAGMHGLKPAQVNTRDSTMNSSYRYYHPLNRGILYIGDMNTIWLM